MTLSVIALHHNDIQHYDIQYVDTQYVDTQHNDTTQYDDTKHTVERQLIKAATHRSDNSSKRQLTEHP